MSPQFNNMNELTSYLEAMENRVKTLEGQNDSLTHLLTESAGDAKKMLPKTGLISRSFFKRAFTVWGHYFVASLIIGMVLFFISLVIVLLIPGLVSFLRNMFSNGIIIR
jgi:hypothetical protein